MTRYLIALLLLCSLAEALLPQRSLRQPSKRRSGSSLLMVDPTLASKEVASAQFFLWFFGGSGAAGVGLSRLPGLYEEWKGVQELKGQGKTAGGPKLAIPSALLGYPEDISIQDVRQILKNPTSVDQMIAKGPKETYLASRGYLTFEAFEKANAKCNPLATRAVFDMFFSGAAPPDEAQALLDRCRDDPSGGLEVFKGALIAGKVRSNAALIALIGILAFVAQVCIESAQVAFF